MEVFVDAWGNEGNEQVTCHVCYGSGVEHEETCLICGGYGWTAVFVPSAEETNHV